MSFSAASVTRKITSCPKIKKTLIMVLRKPQNMSYISFRYLHYSSAGLVLNQATYFSTVASRIFTRTSFIFPILTYLFTYLLIYSMKQNPSWEANLFSASQDIPCILWNPKVHFHITKWLPLVPFLSQINPVLALHPTFWRSILLLSSYLRLYLPSGPFPSGFLTNILYSPLFFQYSI
jgi:hypothetical protein